MLTYIFAVSEALQTSLIVMCGGVLTAMVVGYQTTRSKREDYRRQDEVAQRAKEVADNAAREAAAVASTAREAAALLLEAQAVTMANTEQVAKTKADRFSTDISGSGLKALVISYPNGARREIHLNGTPNEGHHILLKNTPIDGQPLQVAKVLWVEANDETHPSVVLVVVSPEDYPSRRVGDLHDLMAIVKTVEDDVGA